MKIETDEQYIWCLIVIQKKHQHEEEKGKKKSQEAFCCLAVMKRVFLTLLI